MYGMKARRQQPRVRLLWCAAVVMAWGLLAFPAVATAQSSMPLDVTVGFGGSGVAGTWTPVTVDFRPDTPVSGEVRVLVETMEGSWSFTRPVEIAAGAPATVRMVVPPGRLRTTLVSDGEVIASADRRHDPQGAEILIGVTGDDVTTAPSVNVLPAEASARWVSVDAQWLGIPRGTASLDALVLVAGQWPDLDEQARDQLWTEVALGGLTLVVTDPEDGMRLPRPVATDAPSPEVHLVTGDDGQPAAAVRSVGLGRVAVVPGGHQQMGDGDVWAAVVGPRGVLDPVNDWEAYERMPWAAQEMMMAAGDGAQAPGIPYLGIFLAAYVVAVGPLNVLLLRRWGRPEWAWISVPAVSLLFAAAPLVMTRPETGQLPLTVHTLTTWLEGAGQERISAAWPVLDTGAVEARLAGNGWAGVPWADPSPGRQVRTERDGLVLDAQLRTGEMAGLVAHRTITDAAPPIDVTATVTEEGQVAVDVNNASEATIRQVSLMIGNTRHAVGDLAPGRGVSQMAGGRLTAGRVGPDLRALRDGSAWVDVGPGAVTGLLPAAVRVGTPGIVWVVGVTDPSDVVVEVDGRPAQQRASGVVAVGALIDVDAPASRMPAGAVLGQLVDADSGTEPRAANDGMGAPAVMRFRLPPLAEDAQLAGSLFGWGPPQTVQLWDHTARTWRDVEPDFPGVPASPLLTATGEAYARLTGAVDGAGLAVVSPGDPPPPGPLEPPHGTEFEVIEGPDGTFTEIAVPPPPGPAPPVMVTPTPEPTLPRVPTPSVTPSAAGPPTEETGR